MTTRRGTFAARLRTTALAAVLAATSFAVTATPGAAPAADTASSPFAGIVAVADRLFAPRTALAAFCASNPAFTGWLTASTGSHPQAARITDPDLYAWISDVDSTWSCTAYLRFSGVAWNTTASGGRFDWGNLIESTSVSCNYAVTRRTRSSQPRSPRTTSTARRRMPRPTRTGSPRTRTSRARWASSRA